MQKDVQGNQKVKSVRPEARFGGRAPSAGIEPGEYLCKCVAAWCKPRGRETVGVWQFQIHDGAHQGATFRKWSVIADEGGVVSFSSAHAKHCEIALSRPVTENDDPTDLASIFVGKVFVVRIAYRRTDKPRGGKPANDTVKKDDSDDLRVHEILRRFG